MLNPLPTTTFCEGVNDSEDNTTDESLAVHESYPPAVVRDTPLNAMGCSGMTLPTMSNAVTPTNGRSLLMTATVMDAVEVRPALVTTTVNTDVVPTANEDAARMTKFCALLPEGRLKLHVVAMTGNVWAQVHLKDRPAAAPVTPNLSMS